MRLILKAHAGRLQHALALDIDAFVAVDQDVVDGLILEQGFERAQARHLVENFRDEVVELLGIERQPLDQHILRDQLLHVAADFFFRQLFQRRQIGLFDQAAVQPHFGVQELVGEQRIIGSRRDWLGGGFRQHGPRHRLKQILLRRRHDLRSGDAARGKTTDHDEFLKLQSATYDRAHDSLNFLAPSAASLAGLATPCGTISFLSCSVILLPFLTSSSGTPRSMASRTSP